MHHANQFTSSDKHHLSNMWMAYNVTTSCSPLFGYITVLHACLHSQQNHDVHSKQPTQSKLERLLSPDFMSRSTPRQNVGTQSSIPSQQGHTVTARCTCATRVGARRCASQGCTGTQRNSTLSSSACSTSPLLLLHKPSGHTVLNKKNDLLNACK